MKLLISVCAFSLAILVGYSHASEMIGISASDDGSKKEPCGLSGSVDERIADCSGQEDSTKEGFLLVTRSEGFREVHKEIRTGLLWSDRLPTMMNQYSSWSACARETPELLEAVGGFRANWRLPSKVDFEKAERNGIRRALPRMYYWFWSSSGHSAYTGWLFNGDSGDTVFYHPDFNFSVRCVAR